MQTLQVIQAVPTEERRGMPRPTLSALTGARFFAALAVVIGHYKQNFGVPEAIAPAANLGPAAVAFFYLLSGFVLTYCYAEKDFGWRGFMRARLARIYPTYLLGLMLGTLAIHLEGKPVTLRMDLAWVENLFALQDFVPLRISHVFNSPSWSISCEFFFYALFPAALYAMPATKKSLIWVAVAAFVIEGLVLTVSMAELPGFLSAAHVGWPMTIAGDLFVYRVPPFRLGEFVIGIAIALLFRNHPRVLTGAQCTAILGVGTLAVLGIVWIFPFRASYDSPWNMLLFFWVFIPIFGVMLLAMANGRGVLCRILAAPVIVLFGEASFSMYILHEPLLRIAQSFQVSIVVPFVATIGLPIACLHWYERPIRKWLR